MKLLTTLLLSAALFACGNDETAEPDAADVDTDTDPTVEPTEVVGVVPAFAASSDDLLFLDQVIQDGSRTIFRFIDKVSIVDGAGAAITVLYRCDDCWLAAMTVRGDDLFVFESSGTVPQLLRIDLGSHDLLARVVLDGVMRVSGGVRAVFRDDEVLYATADTQDVPSTWSIHRALLAGGMRPAIPTAAPAEQLAIETSRRFYWVENDWTLHTLLLDETQPRSTNLIAGSSLVGLSLGAVVRLGYLGGARQTVRIDTSFIAAPFTSDTSVGNVSQIGSRADSASNTRGFFVASGKGQGNIVFRPSLRNGEDITPIFTINDAFIDLRGIPQWDTAMVKDDTVFLPVVSHVRHTIEVVRVELAQH